MDWLIDRILRSCSSEDIRLSPLARAHLKSRAWTGNLRALTHCLETAAACCEDGVIDITDLPPPPLQHVEVTPGGDEDLEALLTACDWNMSQVARRLGINRSTVLRRVRKAGLRVPSLR